VSLPTADRRLAAGIVGSLTLLAIGWTGLLVPSLIRSIKDAFDQTDAGIGVVYLVYAIAYAAGSVLGGQSMERIGRRRVLTGAALLHGLGVAGLGLAPSWPLFIVATLPSGLGAGCLDGGSNGLVLDVYREGRGRAMNLLHVSFSVGALLAPLAIGRAVEAGVTWETIMLLSAAPLAALAAAYAVVPMPSGRRESAGASSTAPAAAARLLSGPLLLLGVAIACYVAAEIGVSNWLVRFLEPAPIATATLAVPVCQFTRLSVTQSNSPLDCTACATSSSTSARSLVTRRRFDSSRKSWSTRSRRCARTRRAFSAESARYSTRLTSATPTARSVQLDSAANMSALGAPSTNSASANQTAHRSPTAQRPRSSSGAAVETTSSATHSGEAWPPVTAIRASATSASTSRARTGVSTGEDSPSRSSGAPEPPGDLVSDGGSRTSTRRHVTSPVTAP